MLRPCVEGLVSVLRVEDWRDGGGPRVWRWRSVFGLEHRGIRSWEEAYAPVAAITMCGGHGDVCQGDPDRIVLLSTAVPNDRHEEPETWKAAEKLFFLRYGTTSKTGAVARRRRL